MSNACCRYFVYFFLNPNKDCLMDLFKINVKRKMMVPI